MKKVMVLMVVCAMVLTLGVGNAAAAWVTCTITQAGSCAFGVNMVRMSSTSPAFTDVEFWIWDSFPDAKNILAAALTAVATTGKVSANIDPGQITEGSPCYGIIVLPQ
jgi:hypothetical protein